MLPLLLLPQTDEVYKHLSNTKPSTPETTPDKLHAIMAELAPHSDYFFCLAESQKLQYFLPEIFLAALIVGLLFVGAIEIIYKKDFKPTSMLVWRSACAGLLAAAVLYTVQMFDTIPVAPAFSGYLFIAPGLATSKLLVTLSVLLVLYCSESYLREHTRHLLEFSLIVLLAALLLLLLVAANNLMTVFFAIAGFSLAMYILVLFDGYLLPSREAGLKYFYLSALSTGMLLFGIFLVYRTVGSTDYTQIALYLDGVRFRRLSTFLPLEERCLYFGIVFIFFGFMFKLSAFPAHLWAVEVYEGSPAPVTAFFILPVKIAVFLTLARLLNTAFDSIVDVRWSALLAFAAFGSLLWGAFAAIGARKVTRFLGYTSINQIGFLLIGLSIQTPEALRATYVYLIVYAIMTAGFLVIFLQARRADGRNLTFLADFAGLNRKEKILCWHLAIYLFSMAGIPPLGGFFAKYYLFQAAMPAAAYGLIIVGLATSLLSSYYYLRLIKVFWFEEKTLMKRKKVTVYLNRTHRSILTTLEALLWTLPVYAFFTTSFADTAIHALIVTN